MLHVNDILLATNNVSLLNDTKWCYHSILTWRILDMLILSSAQRSIMIDFKVFLTCLRNLILKRCLRDLKWLHALIVLRSFKRMKFFPKLSVFKMMKKNLEWMWFYMLPLWVEWYRFRYVHVLIFPLLLLYSRDTWVVLVRDIKLLQRKF